MTIFLCFFYEKLLVIYLGDAVGGNDAGYRLRHAVSRGDELRAPGPGGPQRPRQLSARL